MERLTKRIDGWVMRKGCHGICRACTGAECADLYPMIDRLADYEDTGLTPEEVKALVPTPNDPLTLEELREKNGEPVWVCSPDNPNDGRYGIVWVSQKWEMENWFVSTVSLQIKSQ